MAALRALTRPHHDRIEKELDLVDPAITRPAYTALLARFYGFYVPLEDALGVHDWDALGLDWPARRKRGLLEAGLAALGVGAEGLGRWMAAREGR